MLETKLGSSVRAVSVHLPSPFPGVYVIIFFNSEITLKNQILWEGKLHPRLIKIY